MTVDNKESLISSLKNNDDKIIIINERIINKLKLLDDININKSDLNRCKYILNKQIDSVAFLGSFGFAPMISDICNISFVNALSLISTVGLSEILTILTKYKVKYKNEKIILSMFQ